jgi:hypothetical protein
VFIALSGTAYAVDGPLPGQNTVGSADIINGEVYSGDVRNDNLGGGGLAAIDLRDGSVRTSEVLDNQIFSSDVRNDSLPFGGLTAADLRPGSVGSSEVLNDSLTGADISDGGIRLADLASDSVNSSKVAFNSLNRTDITDSTLTGGEIANNSLTGADVNESTLSVPSMGCQTGLVHSFARVKGSTSVPSSFTSNPTHIDRAYNCSGLAPQVRRIAEGKYEVRFSGNPATLAFVAPQLTPGFGSGDLIFHAVGVSKGVNGAAATDFSVRVVHNDQHDDFRDAWFSIWTP